MSNTVRTRVASAEPGSALVHVLRAHREGWNGTICESPERWRCGAPEAFRVNECGGDRPSCPDLAAFKPGRPVLRVRTPGLVDWLRDESRELENLLLFALSASRRADVSGTLFVQGVYRIGTAIVRNGDQAIVKPEGDDWTPFPPFAVPVERAPWRLDDDTPGAVPEHEARRWIDTAREAGRTPDPARGWTEEMRERLERFCNDKAAIFEFARERTSDGVLDGLPCIVATEQDTSADPGPHDARTREETDTGSPPALATVEPRSGEPDPSGNRPDSSVGRPIDARPVADPPTTGGDARDLPSPAPPAPWSVVREPRGPDIGSEALAKRLREVSALLGSSVDDLYLIDAFARAGEIVWLRGKAAQRTLRAYAHAVSGGSIHESPVGPTTLDVDDLWRDPATRAPTGLARAWTFAQNEPDTTVLASLSTIDAGVMRPWIGTLANVLRAPGRPGNLLVVATSTEDGSPAGSFDAIGRWLIPIEPLDAAENAARMTAVLLAGAGATGVEDQLAARSTRLVHARESRIPLDVLKPWTGRLVERPDVDVERVVRATAFLVARTSTTETDDALEQALEWLDAVTAEKRGALSGGLGAGYRRLDAHIDRERKDTT